MRLGYRFFKRGAEEVAYDLLGKVLIRKLGKRLICGVILETEAYVGPEDKASHAYGGRRTERTKVMFGRAGLAYVYFTYGMHWMLNIVTGKVGDPQAVLIRGLDIVSGPARITKTLHIDKKLNGEDLVESKKLWAEDWGFMVPRLSVEVTPRIGVDYAGEWKDKPLRYVVKPDLSEKLSLKMAVYKVISLIPKGRVLTYKAVAEKAGKIFERKARKKIKINPRTVGQLLHSNPNPNLIPCHRVVGSDGRLAIHFAFGGERRQKELLLSEGVKFKNKTFVDLDTLWKKE